MAGVLNPSQYLGILHWLQIQMLIACIKTNTQHKIQVELGDKV